MFEITFEDPTNGHTWTDVYYQTDLPQIKQHAKSTGVQLLRVRQLSAHHVFSTNLGGTPE